MSPIAFNTTTPLTTPTTRAAAASSTSSTSSSSSSGSTSIGSTFLNLLVQELQNQDPTAPMDSTAMVGQMISLNQLDQLISINQAVGGSSTTVTNSTGSTQGATAAVQGATGSGSGSASGASTGATAASQALPFDPTTMMPVGFASNNAISNALNTPLATSTTTPLIGIN